jgi:hypothetical protein
VLTELFGSGLTVNLLTEYCVGVIVMLAFKWCGE